jgi:hypothetical protein
VLIFLALIAWAPVAAFHKPLGFLAFAFLFPPAPSSTGDSS